MGRGPFAEAADRDLLEAERIDIIVAKNSGGSATYGKIAAARSLALPVILLRRPPLPQTTSVETIEAAVAWLAHGLTLATDRGV